MTQTLPAPQEFTIPRLTDSATEFRTGRMQVFMIRSESITVEKDIPIPYSVIERYAREASRLAVIETTEEGELYASIPGFVGVWATAENHSDLLDELRSVVQDWATLKLIDGDDDLPPVADLDLRRFG